MDDGLFVYVNPIHYKSCPKGLQIMAVDAFFHDWVLMPKLEKLGQLTFFHLLNVDGVLSISVDWVELKSVFLCQIDMFLIQF